jgi:hypothetical protein
MSTPTHAVAPAPPDGDASDEDYETLLSTLSGSARGRAFLAEHARRARHADTAVLLAAIERLEALMCVQAGSATAAAPAQSQIGDDGAEVSQDRPASDPLAALKALTDDERLALFT